MRNNAFQPQEMIAKAKTILFMGIVCLPLLFLSSNILAATDVKTIHGDNMAPTDSSAINTNFRGIGKELQNCVHKSSTETIHGYKYFIDPVSIGTFTATLGTITTLSGTSITETSGAFSSITSNSIVVSTLTASSATITALSMGGVLNMQSHKITNLTNGSSAQDGAAFGQIPLVATQAQEESGSVTTAWTAPGVQQNHPSSAKAWVIFVGTGTVTILASYNVSSITDNGTGDYSINFTTPFSSSYYSCICIAAQQSGGSNRICSRKNSSRSASSWNIHIFDTGGTNFDAEEVDATCYGDQ